MLSVQHNPFRSIESASERPESEFHRIYLDGVPLLP